MLMALESAPPLIWPLSGLLEAEVFERLGLDALQEMLMFVAPLQMKS